MEYLKKYIALFLAIIAIFLMPAASFAWRPTSVVVFGDGSSDNGLTYLKYKVPASPPYWHGRFANGPVWVELVAHKLGLIPNPYNEPFYPRQRFFYNYAQYMSVILPQNAMINKFMPLSLKQQVDEYATHWHSLSKNALAFIWIGINDYYAPLCLKDPLDCDRRMMDTMMVSLKRLYKLGVRHVVLLTFPLQEYQACSLLWLSASQRERMIASARNSSRQYDYVRAALEKEYKDYKVLVFNVELVERYTASRTRVNNTPCYDGRANYQKKVAKVCSNPDEYYLWDNCYPSRVFHQYLAQAMIAALRQNGWMKNSWWDFIWKDV